MSEQIDFKSFAERLDRFTNEGLNQINELAGVLTEIESRYKISLFVDRYRYRSLKGMLFDVQRFVQSVRDMHFQTDEESYSLLLKLLNEYRPEQTGWFPEYEVPGSYEACMLFHLFFFDVVEQRELVNIKRLLAIYRQYYSDFHYIHDLIKRLQKNSDQKDTTFW